MIHVTRHAVERYQQRVADVPASDVIAALSSPFMELAAGFGSPCVILGTGQKVILKGKTVVTVKPKRGA